MKVEGRLTQNEIPPGVNTYYTVNREVFTCGKFSLLARTVKNKHVEI